MKLLYDVVATQPLSGQHHGGSEYARTLLLALLEHPDRQGMLGCYDPDRPLADDIRASCREAGVELVATRSTREISHAIAQHGVTRFYSALPYHYHDLDLVDAEFVFTIHGLRPIEVPTDRHEIRHARTLGEKVRVLAKRALPGLYRIVRKRQFGKLVSPTDGERHTIIVPSYHTKYALLTAFPHLDPGSVHVSFSPRRRSAAGAPSKPEPDAADPGWKSEGDYFLLVSANRWIKNAVRAVRALDELYSERPDLPGSAVLLGVSDRRVFGRLENPGRFEFRGYVTRAELDAHYAGAFALIFPTLNEGFGYPPLESMSYGVPVLCSAVSSTTEICGDAAIYFDPHEPAELKNRVLYLRLEPGVRDRYGRAGLERAAEVAESQDRMLSELCALLLRSP